MDWELTYNPISFSSTPFLTTGYIPNLATSYTIMLETEGWVGKGGRER